MCVSLPPDANMEKKFQKDLDKLIMTHVSKDPLCPNGYVLNKLMEQGNNIKQTARELMSIYQWKLSETTVANRISAARRKLVHLKKQVNTNWEALNIHLKTPFDITPEVSRKRKSETITQGGPSPKKQVLKSDCEKCPEYRDLLRDKLKEKSEEYDSNIRKLKKDFDVKNVNRQKRDNYATKKKLRARNLGLKKEIRIISKEKTELQLLVSKDIMDELKKQKAKTNRNH